MIFGYRSNASPRTFMWLIRETGGGKPVHCPPDDSQRACEEPKRRGRIGRKLRFLGAFSAGNLRVHWSTDYLLPLFWLRSSARANRFDALPIRQSEEPILLLVDTHEILHGQCESIEGSLRSTLCARDSEFHHTPDSK
jgi:hypothetical protein